MTPDEFTNQELMLDVGDDHKLYLHDWGKADANTPILFLHGGPGGGCNDGHKGYFDPTKQRVIFFDQRGAGKSLPYGQLEHNTTDDLVGDIDKLLDKLRLDSIVLYGRSWGSTLALCYAVHRPERVTAMVIGGVFLGSNAENVLDDRAEISQLFYPDAWDALSQPRDTLQLWRTVLDADADKAKQAGFSLAQLIVSQMRLDDRTRPLDYDTFDPTSIRIEAHYKTNNWFLPPDHIMHHAAKLTMPVWLIQGRYDTICFPKFAYDLHQALPTSHLVWTQAGHSGNDRENWLATRTILHQFA